MSQSVDLFEVQRIWDAWPNIRNQQVLRDRFRRLCSDSSVHSLRISNVFVIPGHIFVAVSSTSEPKERAVLYVFSCTTRGGGVVSHDDGHVTTCLLEVSRQCTEVLEVIDSGKEGQQMVYVVQNNGELCSYVYNNLKQMWTLNESHQFTTQSGSTVYSCCFLAPPTSSKTASSSRVLLYSAKSPSASLPSQAPCNYQVILRRCNITPGGSLIFGQATVLMEHCPLFDMVGFRDGVCFLPKDGPYPKGLLLFWAPVQDQADYSIRAYVWNLTTPTPFPYDSTYSPSSPLNFKSVILCLAGTWTKVQTEPHLVSVTSHPVTNQLLCLDSIGTVHTLSVAITGTVKRKVLTRLTHVASTYPDFFSFPPLTSRHQLFCFYNSYGVVVNGDIKLYDSISGEYVWETNEHEGMGFRFWRMSKPPGFCGLFGQDGMWILRNLKVSDHAWFLARGVFPVKTNADETTPGHYLDQGQLLAAKLCKMWGLDLLSTKYALEAAYDIMKQTGLERNKDGTVKGHPLKVPEIPDELISLLDERSSLQSPALLVALLAEFPAYRPEITRRVKRFLKDFHDNESGEVHSNDLMTPLNRDLVPLFQKYLELSEESEQLLKTMKPIKTASLTNIRTHVSELLTSAENIDLSSMDSSAAECLRSQFQTLCECHPEDSLQGIKDFFNITSFQEAVTALETEQWESQRNWKDIFATEVATRIERSYLKDTTYHIPIFEETCRLLYHSHPEELLIFVNFAQLARDHQAQGDSAFARKCRKNFFYRRAINALPKFRSVEVTPASPCAVRAYCQLLLNSDHPNSEMLALQLLLNRCLWDDAIKLVGQAKTQENHSFLFHSLLTGLSKASVLSLYIDRAWQLLPTNFNVFDFLNILKTDTSAAPGVMVNEHDEQATLQVSSVSAKLLCLIQQTTDFVGKT